MNSEYIKIGNDLRVTKIENNKIFKINNTDIRDIYKKYFDDDIKNIYEDFPLLLKEDNKYKKIEILNITDNFIEININKEMKIKKHQKVSFGIKKENKALIHFINTKTDELNRKTKKLKDSNRLLLERIEDKVSVICEKEQMLIENAKFATMGEMINMIAHQWRQPLHNINLELIKIKFGNELNNLTTETINNVVNNANKQIQYMSDTIDDFRNFFKKDKERSLIYMMILCLIQ